MNAISLPKYFLILFFVVWAPAMAGAAAINQQDAQIVHLLNRISFGPTPGDIVSVQQMGINAYIEQQLNPNMLPLPRDLQSRLDDLPIFTASTAQVAEHFQPPIDEGKQTPEQREERNKQLNSILFAMSEEKILRAVASPAQLQEVMTDFWFNHFNVFYGKDLDRVFISTYERDAIRPYALGKFRDLLEATARHPAMLVYLDNWQNTDPNSQLARQAARRGKEIGINENYAREVMELHTLGVDGGYTQQDVTTLAHILTGWGIGRGKSWAEKAVFYFDPQRHDYNDTIFMGQEVFAGGMNEVDHVFDLLAAHPSTAHHIAYELAQYFVADDPPASLVNHLAQVFHASGGDIAATLRVLFQSPEFWDPKYEQVKFKPPFRYIVSMLRAIAVVPEGDTLMLQGAIGNMGEPLYRCQTPNGYANTNDQWLNSDALLKRINVAKSLGRFFGDQTAGTIYNAFGNVWAANTLATVQRAAPQMKPVLMLSSPEFLYY